MKIFKILAQSLRMIRAYRLYSLINIAGLALGIACVIALSRYIYRELSTDSGNKHAVGYVVDMGKEDRGFGMGSTDLARLQSLPYVGDITREVMSISDMGITVGENKLYVDLLVTDSNFYKVFDFPFVSGDPRQVLRNPDEAVISVSLAKKLFGKDDPMGKVIGLQGKEVRITGVVDERRANSSFVFDIQVNQGLTRMWGRMGVDFFTLTDPSRLEEFNAAAQFERVPGYFSEQKCELRPFSDFYFDTSIARNGTYRTGNIRNVYILEVVAFIVLLIALFNYINIYMVTLQKRSREIGVKRVFGAGGGTMLGQFIIENLLTVTAAVAAALLLVSAFSGKALSAWNMDIGGTPLFNAFFTFALWIVLPVVSAVYPYLRYVRSQPSLAIRPGHSGGRLSFTRALFLTVQYVMTITVIVVSMFFMRQLNCMLDCDLGYRPDHVIRMKTIGYEEWLSLPEDEQIKLCRAEPYIAAELSKVPGVEAFCFGDSPNKWRSSWTDTYGYRGENYPLVCGYVSQEYMKVFGIPMRQGRSFIDSLDGYRDETRCLVNESAMRLIGASSLDSLILKEVTRTGERTRTVIGVVGDYYFEHLSKRPSPMIFWFDGGGGDFREGINVRYREGSQQAVITALKKIHDELLKGSFEYSFLEDEIAAMYREDRRVASIYGLFALIAVFISSLGLFSLSLYDVRQRYREIAIRKVNGARTGEVMRLLTIRYYKLLLIAFAVAVPVSWYAVAAYLDDFAVKTPFSMWVFLLAGGVTALISLLTLWWQTWRAATENPANAIKTE